MAAFDHNESAAVQHFIQYGYSVAGLRSWRGTGWIKEHGPSEGRTSLDIVGCAGVVVDA